MDVYSRIMQEKKCDDIQVNMVYKSEMEIVIREVITLLS